MGFRDGFVQDLVNELARRKARPDCPSCGQQDWSGWGLTNNIIALKQVLPDGTAPNPQPLDPTVSFACKQCGFVKLFSLKILSVRP